MRLRAYCEKDLPEVVTLLNEVYRGEYEFIPSTAETMGADLKVASCILVATDEQDRILGMAYLRQNWYGETLELCARDIEGKERVEDLLLSAIEPENKTGTISTSVAPEEQKRIAYFTARGYQIETSLYQLIRELDQLPPLPQLPSHYVLRSLRPDEEDALIQLANAGYNNERLRPGTLDKWRAQDSDFRLDWVQVAEYGGQLVAMVRGCSDHEYNEHYHDRRGYLGPAATLPAHRAKGLSKALTIRAMSALRDHGMQSVCLYTWKGNPAALELTKDLGFHLGHEWKIMRKTPSQLR